VRISDLRREFKEAVEGARAGDEGMSAVAEDGTSWFMLADAWREQQAGLSYPAPTSR
jgi:hypothetical protein